MESYKEETIKAYNENVESFSSKFKALMVMERRPEFNEFIGLLGGKEVLDLGSGPGDHAEYFVKKGLKVTCIDLSEEMILLCKKKELNASVMDIEDLNFPEASFDGIWAVTSLLHVPKAKMGSVAKKLGEIIKKNGILFIEVKKGDGEKMVYDETTNSNRFFSFWEMDELLDCFKDNFELITSKETGDLREEKYQKINGFIQIFLRKK